MNTFGSITYEFFNNKKNYHFDLTGAFSNIIEESEAIEYDDDDDEELCLMFPMSSEDMKQSLSKVLF